MPILLVCALVTTVAQLAQTGVILSLHPLKPDFKRLNPISGVKRLLSITSVWETVKQAAKGIVIAMVARPRIEGFASALTGNGRVPLLEGVASIGGELLGLIRAIAWTVVAIALADYAFQKRKHMRDMKMTKQEIRDEMRGSEGDPQVKQRIRAMQMAMGRRRMMSDVGTATVVLTNPTHVAVAIRYETGGGGAPKVVASGADALALRIRERARRGRGADRRGSATRPCRVAQLLGRRRDPGHAVRSRRQGAGVRAADQGRAARRLDTAPSTHLPGRHRCPGAGHPPTPPQARQVSCVTRLGLRKLRRA